MSKRGAGSFAQMIAGGTINTAPIQYPYLRTIVAPAISNAKDKVRSNRVGTRLTSCISLMTHLYYIYQKLLNRCLVRWAANSD